MERIYHPPPPPWACLPIRIAVGVVFIAHGGQKLFVWGLAGTTVGMSHMGIPLPGVAAVVAVLVEFAGGIALLVGFYTRLAALFMVCEMLVVILFVKLGGGLLGPHGFQLEFLLLAGALTLVALGGGGVSVDEWLRRRAAEVGKPAGG